uniref:Uncharacterized protein n=1 Tax=Kalanchoe fedtschenkoi TaxID=63787 RepID=A0A7N0URC8_KALFE
METDVRDPMIVKGGGDRNGMESPKTVLLEAAEGEENVETCSLLAPRMGGMARNGEKRRLSVQWNDAHGNKLAEVLEFQPSEASDSEEDESDACTCCIM